MSGAGREHRWPVRVYFEDTDFSGVVYHAAYLRLLERGRTELLREAGVDARGLFAAGHSFAVRHMTLDFARPARMDDLLAIRSVVAKVGGASLLMRQAVQRGDETLVEADVRLGLVLNGRAVRFPPRLVELLSNTPLGGN